MSGLLQRLLEAVSRLLRRLGLRWTACLFGRSLCLTMRLPAVSLATLWETVGHISAMLPRVETKLMGRRNLHTLVMLDGRDILAAGLGLGAFKLILLPSAGSLAAPARALPDVSMLLGRPPLRVAGAPAAGLGGGWEITVTAFGRQNMPRPTPPHSKYRSPLTLPSFFPELSSSSTPTHSPVWKFVRPRNRMTAVRPLMRRTVWPSARPSSSDMASSLPRGCCRRVW